jgi:hypothetical protein
MTQCENILCIVNKTFKVKAKCNTFFHSASKEINFIIGYIPKLIFMKKLTICYSLGYISFVASVFFLMFDLYFVARFCQALLKDTFYIEHFFLYVFVIGFNTLVLCFFLSITFEIFYISPHLVKNLYLEEDKFFIKRNNTYRLLDWSKVFRVCPYDSIKKTYSKIDFQNGESVMIPRLCYEHSFILSKALTVVNSKN